MPRAPPRDGPDVAHRRAPRAVGSTRRPVESRREHGRVGIRAGRRLGIRARLAGVADPLERPSQCVRADGAPGAVVGEHLGERDDRPLGAVGDGEPGDRAVPGAEGEAHEVVELLEVGALVRDHRGELVVLERLDEAVGEHGRRADAGDAVGQRHRVREHARARLARHRVAQEVDELVLAAALALGPHRGQGEVQHEQQRDGRGERERRDLRDPESGGEGPGEHVRGERADGGGQGARRCRAEGEEASDHRQPAGERDRLPEREGRRGSARGPGGARERDGHGPRECEREGAEHRRDGEHAQRRASSSSRRRSVAASPVARGADESGERGVAVGGAVEHLVHELGGVLLAAEQRAVAVRAHLAGARHEALALEAGEHGEHGGGGDGSAGLVAQRRARRAARWP